MTPDPVLDTSFLCVEFRCILFRSEKNRGGRWPLEACGPHEGLIKEKSVLSVLVLEVEHASGVWRNRIYFDIYFTAFYTSRVPNRPTTSSFRSVLLSVRLKIYKVIFFPLFNSGKPLIPLILVELRFRKIDKQRYIAPDICKWLDFLVFSVSFYIHLIWLRGTYKDRTTSTREVRNLWQWTPAPLSVCLKFIFS